MLSALSALPEMEFQVPRPYDRAYWQGGDGLVVAGIPRKFAELAAAGTDRRTVMVFPIRGEPFMVGFNQQLERPLLMIKPVEIVFGTDPEADRLRAIKRLGNTITTKTEELAGLVDSRTNGARIEEDTSTAPPYYPGGYVLSHSLTACFDVVGQVDADQDGIRDSCEAEIANAFRPGLMFSVGEPAGERDSYWSVRRSNHYPRALSVFYALGYHHDGGDVGLGTYEHDGDSEFIVIAVSEQGDAWPGGRWTLETVTFSAHWHSLWDRTSERRYYEGVQWVDGTYCGRPRTYVSQSKHANYHTAATCGSHFDTCNPSPPDHETAAYPFRNLGNHTAAGWPLWTNPCSTSEFPGLSATECFWFDDKFRGWMTENGDGGTGYKEMLAWYDF